MNTTFQNTCQIEALIAECNVATQQAHLGYAFYHDSLMNNDIKMHLYEIWAKAWFSWKMQLKLNAMWCGLHSKVATTQFTDSNWNENDPQLHHNFIGKCH
jgi:hypothetical protein